MHYQFETIHPFLDGNGRIGRLLVGLTLADQGRLGAPLLYLSAFLETHRTEYYAHLQHVREAGNLNGFLKFFLLAVKEQSEDAIQRAQGLVRLRQAYYKGVEADRSRVPALIPMIFASPFISSRLVEKALSVTPQGARGLLARAESYGWIRPFTTFGKGGMQLYIAQQVFEVIESPLAYDRVTEVPRRDFTS